MRDKLRAKARFKISDSPEQVGIESVPRGCLSDGGMKSNGSLNSKRDIRVPVSVGLCSYWNGKSEKSEEQEGFHECCTRQQRCPHNFETVRTVVIDFNVKTRCRLVVLSLFLLFRVARSLN